MKKEVMQSVYEYHFNSQKEKFATCKLCAANNKEVVIKMLDGNTTGTTRHLKKFHIEEAKKIFPESSDQPKKVVIALTIIILFFTI